MQSNSEEQREKATDISLNVSPEQTQLVVDLGKKKKKKNGSPLDQWLKRRGMFTYRAHVTIIYQTDSKGVQKAERLCQ